MRSKNLIYIYCVLIVLCACLAFPLRAERQRACAVDSALVALDIEIGRAGEYRARKENKISMLRNMLVRSRSAKERFMLSHSLYDEYRFYQSDSAYVYARAMADEAARSGDQIEENSARIALMECYTTVGLFKEAAEQLAEIDKSLLPREDVPEFLDICCKLYQNMESYVGNWKPLNTVYHDLRRDVYREIDTIVPPDMFIHATSRIERERMDNEPLEKSIAGRLAICNMTDATDHQQAVNASLLGAYYRVCGDTDKAIYWLAMSAIFDIRSCTRETTAAKDLAWEMYLRGDLHRANRYIHLALDDANFYGSRIRSIEINSMMPTIESSRYMVLSNQRLLLIFVVATVVCLLLLSLYLFIKLKKRNRRLNESHLEIRQKSQELEDANANLQHLNANLSDLNGLLKEANEIKDQYIIQSLYGNSDFVGDVEGKVRVAVAKIKSGHADKALKPLSEIGIKRERERMFNSFDSAFLKLFPNFIDEFNKLFPPEHRILTQGETLPTEIRIFALMRLGISNPSEVANYLNLSVNTVYVYKTKIKSRSAVDKDDFDSLVMSIPKP